MDFFRTVAYDNPSRAMDILSMHTRAIPDTPEELADGLKGTMRNLRHGEKEEFLRALTEIHPDYELFRETIEPNYDEAFENFSERTGACGCKAGANGQAAVNTYMATGEAQQLMSQYNEKLNRIEIEQNTTKTVNDKVFKIVVVGIIAILAYKILLKK
jgi:hypothetical protein